MRREIEVELILTRWEGDFPADFPILSANPVIEDRRSDGLGIILTEEFPPVAEADEAIERFLRPFVPDAEMLSKFGPVVRVLVFNRAFTCSVTISSLPLIMIFRAELDFVVYPTSVDEDDDED